MPLRKSVFQMCLAFLVCLPQICPQNPVQKFCWWTAVKNLSRSFQKSAPRKICLAKFVQSVNLSFKKYYFPYRGEYIFLLNFVHLYFYCNTCVLFLWTWFTDLYFINFALRVLDFAPGYVRQRYVCCAHKVQVTVLSTLVVLRARLRSPAWSPKLYGSLCVYWYIYIEQHSYIWGVCSIYMYILLEVCVNDIINICIKNDTICAPEVARG